MTKQARSSLTDVQNTIHKLQQYFTYHYNIYSQIYN